jgi:hypothetical protein
MARINVGDSWILRVASYAYNESPDLERFREAINSKRNTVNDSGATYRLINHWADEGLIEDSRQDAKKGWRRLSFLDLVWIQVLVELRKYGVPLDLLRLARSAIFEVPDNPTIVKPDFEYAIASCLRQSPLRFLIVFFSDGFAEVTDEGTLELGVKSTLFTSNSYLLVDLNQCCKSVSPKTPLPSFRVNNSLSDEEETLIESIRSGEYDVVEVHGADGKIDRIKCRVTTNKLAERLDELAKRIKYGDFTVKIQDGKATLTEVTESKKV